MMDIEMNDHAGMDSDDGGDGEGVWSPDIEQCFREALAMYPPCGRRKHILQEEGGGKMYGRNELIARYIMLQTGKRRTRKQVSSHIQVLARRKAKADASINGSTGVSPSPSSIDLNRPKSEPRPNHLDPHHTAQLINNSLGGAQQVATTYFDIWADRPIATPKIRLVEFSAFIEYRNFQQPSPHSVSSLNGYAASSSNSTTPVTEVTSLNHTLSSTHHSLNTNQATHYHQQQVNLFNNNNNNNVINNNNNNHVLTSNHHLPAQFNQASSYHQNSPNLANNVLGSTNYSSHLNQPGFIRHSYVKIDYRRSFGRQSNKLERIHISQIQDKLPGISGPDGLFQRGPPDAFFLVKFWADLDTDFEYNIEDQNSYFGFSTHFETVDHYKDIRCSTKACSYGEQVVEKVEKIYSNYNSSSCGGPHSYIINRSPMCEFMIRFIKELRQLPEVSQMNRVLENFSVLQVITCDVTSEILLCIGYVFEVAPSNQNQGPQYNVYKLTKD